MQIHETAFIVSTYRSLQEDISKDSFAKLWNNPVTDPLIPDILEKISRHEAIMHSLRNRYFHEQLNIFFKDLNKGTFINFGAGFSMYQFLLNDTVSTIEIDKKDIVDYKKEKVDLWTTEGKLPKRDVQYISLDFNLDTEEDMILALKPLIKKQPTFILLEGVLFFLNSEITGKLFRVFKNLQLKNDVLGCVSYLPEVENTKVYKSLLHYFDSNNDTNDSFSHQTIPNSYYKDIDGYELQEYADEYGLSQIYSPELLLKDKKEILNENMYLLKRS